MEKENVMVSRSTNNNNSSCVCSYLIGKWFRKDDYIWSVLGTFYNDNELGFSIRKIQERIKQAGLNTIPNCFKRLKKNNLIYLVARRVGPNKSEKYYKITEQGILLFEMWMQFEAKKSIQRKLKV